MFAALPRILPPRLCFWSEVLIVCRNGQVSGSSDRARSLGSAGNGETAVVSGPSVGLSHTCPLPRTSWKRRNSTSIRPHCRLVPHIWRACPTPCGPKNHTVTSGEGCASKSARSDLGPAGNCETALVSGHSVGLSHTSGGLIPCILRAPKSHRNIGGRLREQERTLRPPPLPRTSWGRPNSTSIRPLSHTSGGLVPRTLRAPKSHRNAGGRLRSKGARVRTRTTPPPPPPSGVSGACREGGN